MRNKYLYIAAGIIILTGMGVVFAMMMATTEEASIITPDEDEVEIITPTAEWSGSEAINSNTPEELSPIANPAPTTECFVGGCSGQICSSNPDMASTCEFRAEYACYKEATCEVQPSGACGWTPSAELNACLANPPDMM